MNPFEERFEIRVGDVILSVAYRRKDAEEDLLWHRDNGIHTAKAFRRFTKDGVHLTEEEELDL